MSGPVSPETPGPAAPPAHVEADATARVLGTILRWGVVLSATIILIGVALFVVRRGTHSVLLSPRGIPTGAEADPTSLQQIAADFADNEHVPTAVTDIGLLTLMLTPVISVVVSLISFAGRRDWTYVALAALVLAMLAIGTFIGGV